MPLVSAMLILGLVSGSPPDGDLVFERGWRSKANRLLALPSGSVSMGRTSGGHLVRGRRMPTRGHGFALLPHISKRKTRFGTDEMVRFLVRTAKRVRTRMRNTTLRIGNLGYREGGRIPWSVSHRTGRDADLAFFMTNRRGRPVTLRDYVRVDSRGRSRDGRLTFDTRRNLEVVRALLNDSQVHVQWIFVSRHLKRMMLRHAERLAWPKRLVTKMATVMKQPGDSAPHDDHFHVRIYCSKQDVLHGCQNRGPFHGWVRPATDAYLRRVASLKRLTAAPDARYRRNAVNKLLALHAQSAVPTLIERLEDPDATVFKAAIQALKRLGTKGHFDALAASTKRQRSVGRVRATLALMARDTTEQTSRFAAQLLARPELTLSRSVVSSPSIGSIWLTALPMAAKHGKKEEALWLIDEFMARIRRADVLTATHHALRRMTNHDVSRRTSQRRALRQSSRTLLKRWGTFAEQHRHETWRQWVRRGFEARGFRFDQRMWANHSIPVLIEAARHRDTWINVNAVRVLNGITGRSLSPDRRDRHWRSRFFQRVWKRQGSAPRSAKR